MSNKFVALWENKLLVACVGCIGKLITRKRQDQNNTGCFASKNEKEQRQSINSGTRRLKIETQTLKDEIEELFEYQRPIRTQF